MKITILIILTITESLRVRSILNMFMQLIWIVMEASTLGKLGGYDNAINRVVLDKHQNTIKVGFLITIVLYVLFEIVS